MRVPCGCCAGAVRWSTSNCICARRRRSGGTRRTGSLRCCGGISAIFKRLDYDMQCSCPGADPGEGQGGLAPPPIFWGGNKGAKNHTHRTIKLKSDDHEARYRLKRIPKHTKYAQILLKKSCEVGGGGGLRGHKGKYFVHKSNKE